MLRPGSFALTLLLASLTGIGPLSTDMYVPSLPDIGSALYASTEQVQLTISSYLLGFATGQILYGPISDRFGRKPVMMAALVLYAIGSIVCATTQSIEMLAAVRFVQALGGAGAIVLARAVVRDLYSGVRAGRELSLMGSIQALAPILAPVIGGALQTAFGWRASFILLVIFAVTIGTATARLLPETLHKPTPEPFSLAAMGRMFGSVLVHRSFLAHLGIVITTFVGLYAWVAGSSIVIQGVYGLSPLAFGAIYAVGSSGYLLGTNIAARVVMRHAPRPHDRDRHRNHGGGRPVNGGGRGAWPHQRVLAGGRDDDLSDRHGAFHAANAGGRYHPISRSRRHRVFAVGFFPAIFRLDCRRHHRCLSGPIRLAGCRHRCGNGVSCVSLLDADAPRPQSGLLNAKDCGTKACRRTLVE